MSVTDGCSDTPHMYKENIRLFLPLVNLWCCYKFIKKLKEKSESIYYEPDAKIVTQTLNW